VEATPLEPLGNSENSSLEPYLTPEFQPNAIKSILFDVQCKNLIINDIPIISTAPEGLN
jgi:hypothetical protein